MQGMQIRWTMNAITDIMCILFSNSYCNISMFGIYVHFGIFLLFTFYITCIFPLFGRDF